MKLKTLTPPDKRHLWIWVAALLFGAGFWLVDSLVHYLTYAEHLRFMLFQPPDNFLDSLFLGLSNHTLFVRLTFLAASLIAGSLLIRYLDSRTRAEESLKLEQSLSSEIISRSPSIILAVDLEGKTRLLNPIGERILGCSAAEMLGKPCWESIRPENSREELLDWLQQIIRQDVVSEQFTVVSRDGSEHICSWNHVVQQDESSIPAGVISIGRDITDQVLSSLEINRLLKQQIALNRLALDLGETLDLKIIYRRLYSYLKTLADCWTFLVSSYDGSQQLIRAEYVVFEGSEVDTSSLPPIPIDKEGYGSQSRVIRSGEPLSIPNFTEHIQQSKTSYVISANGKVTPGSTSPDPEEKNTLSAVYVPLKVGGATVGVLQLQSPEPAAYSDDDIKLLQSAASVAAVAAQNARLYAELQVELQERSRVEQEVRTLNEELEERVRERTTELEDLNEELENFAYIVSHDLKAPLRAVSQLTTWIQSDYEDLFDADGQRLLELLINRTNRMYNLIQGILDYSRINRTLRRPQPVDLNTIVHDVLENINPPPSIKVELPAELPVVLADEIHMTQVFQNLIDNAIKFMDKEQGVVTLRCIPQDELWQFSVADNGPGIEERFFERIFKIFQTLKPRDQMESTGIGLAIVRKIIEYQGGKIWIESHPGTGTTFHFTLPKKEIPYA